MRSSQPRASRSAASPASTSEDGQHSYVGKILKIHAELPGRIHIVLVRQSAGFWPAGFWPAGF